MHEFFKPTEFTPSKDGLTVSLTAQLVTDKHTEHRSWPSWSLVLQQYKHAVGPRGGRKKLTVSPRDTKRKGERGTWREGRGTGRRSAQHTTVQCEFSCSSRILQYACIRFILFNGRGRGTNGKIGPLVYVINITSSQANFTHYENGIRLLISY